MEELLPFLFFVAYIIISIISGGNKRKKRKRTAQPPVVAQQPRNQPQQPPVGKKPIERQKKPLTQRAKQQQKQQPVLNRRTVPQSYQKPNPNSPKTAQTPKKSAPRQRNKNPFEKSLEDLMRELEMPEVKPRKDKSKTQLFGEKSPQPKPTIDKKKRVVRHRKAIPIVKPGEKLNIKTKVGKFDFNALDAVIYSEIMTRKY